MKASYKKTIFSTAVALAAAVSAMLPGFTTPAYAEDQPAQYLQMSPVYERITLEPGTVYDGEVKIRSAGTDSFTYTMGVTPYSVSGENYDQDFSVATNYTKMVDWITFSQDGGTLGPDETDVIIYHINVPEDAPGGAQYAAITASVERPSDGTSSIGLDLVSRTALILHARVNGETNECGEVVSNNVPTFFFAPPITTSSVLSNCGNVDNEAKYSLKVYPLFSDEELYDSDVDSDANTSNLIMPGVNRYHAMSWQDGSIFGIYNVEQSIEYVGKTDTVKKLVFVIPLWLIIVFIALIGLIVFKLVSNAQKRKQPKK